MRNTTCNPLVRPFVVALCLVSFGLGGCAATNEAFRVDPILNHEVNTNQSEANQNGKLSPIDIGTKLKEFADKEEKCLDNVPQKVEKLCKFEAELCSEADPTIKDQQKDLKACANYKRCRETASAQQEELCLEPPQQTRNELQQQIIARSDAICEQHKGDIIGTAAGLNLFNGIGATVLSTAASITSGGAAKNYAAGATVLNGTGTAINAEIYQGLLKTAIIKAINESRDQKRTEIKTRQNETDMAGYSIDDAIVDAQDYHFRCSFYHGLTVLTKDPEQRVAPTRTEILAKIEVLRNELKATDDLGLDQTVRDATKVKIIQGINALYDKLNATVR